MTIFDKLSGYAQKAKENVVGRAILAKDKRLERSLSDSIDAANVGLLKLSTYGMPGGIAAVAFDPVAGLLAVGGGQNAYIRIFGKGISAAIQLREPVAAIKYMQFKIGYPLLTVVDRKNVITTYDLRTKRARHAVTTPSIVTCINYCTGTDWLFVGFADGNVDIFDMENGSFSESYGIPNLVLEYLPAAAGNNRKDSSNKCISVVVSIQTHPKDLDLVLIGYGAAVFLWSMRDRCAKRVFVTPSGNGSRELTCMAWSPCGNRFVAGYDDGVLLFWDIRHEHRPIMSRRVLHTAAEAEEGESCTPPIYHLAWYTDDGGRSYLIVAGGSDLPGIEGLHVLEFGDSEVRKQSILATPVEVADFILLSSSHYYPYMRSPVGILTVGCDNALRAYGLDHGYPGLMLPPALQFLDPCVSQAFHIPQLSHNVFQHLVTYPSSSSSSTTHHLPLTGGAAASGHIYRIPSNDLLITASHHDGCTIRFWDASFTGLRPLTHLTIHYCDDNNLEKPAIKITHIVFDKTFGTVAVAFDNGQILHYFYSHPADENPDDPFISSCDNTLKEISELLRDMDTLEREGEAPLESNGHEEATETYPADTTSEDSLKKNEPPFDKETSQEKTSRIQIKLLNPKQTESGFKARLMITLESSTTVKHMTFTDQGSLAICTADDDIYIVDMVSGEIIFQQSITERNVNIDTASAVDDNAENTEMSVTCLSILETYSPQNRLVVSKQLYLGADNGSVIQYPLDNSGTGKPTVISPHTDSPVIAIHMIGADNVMEKTEAATEDEHSKATTTSPECGDQELVAGRKSSESTTTKAKDNTDQNNSSKAFGLLRKTTRKFSKSSSNSSSRDTREPVPPLSTATTTTEEPSELFSAASSEQQRSRWEYKPQANPQFLLIVTKVSISVVLAGYNVRLFHARIEGDHQDFIIVNSRVMKGDQGGACLAVLLNNGHIILYSLPNLIPFAQVVLPPDRVTMNKLDNNNVSLSEDGRIVVWTGDCELEQYLILLQNNIPCGENVILHTNQTVIPARPTVVESSTQAKKSWLDTVQSAFQKGPLTVTELDTLLGKQQQQQPRQDQTDSKRKELLSGAKAAAGTSSSSSGGGDEGGMISGVFQELGQKMNERGEKLSQLEAKFEDMNKASSDFLQAVRDYNERQAKKKWWEF